MNSKEKTLDHKQLVSYYMCEAIKELIDRANSHDDSKLEDPEIAYFTRLEPKLESSSYLGDEYNGFLEELKPALDHHYAQNRHHPQHFKNGVKDMDLIDLLEMICDWKASTFRQMNGNILVSIDKNQERFKYSDDLAQILKNTVDRFEKRG